MKVPVLLTISHLLCAAAGSGVALALSGTPWALAGGFGAAALLGLCGTSAVSLLLGRDLGVVARITSGNVHGGRGEPVLQDVAQLAIQARDHVNRWHAAVNSARNALDECRRVLARVDPSAANVENDHFAEHVGYWLSDFSRSVRGDVERIVGCTTEIEQETGGLVHAVDEQTETVSKATTYVEQISANIERVAQSADAARESAGAARESAVEGLGIVRESLDGMERIRLHVEAGEKKLRALGERTVEIGSIVETIGAISDRTDMLALNASIESVRAGEHGRGFALVAEEVRKLAEQAAQASREVADLIESVQRETQESIDVMETERSRVDEEVGRAQAAGQSLEHIGRRAEESEGRVGDISRTMEDQLRLTQDVVMAMERITGTSRTIRTHAEATGRSRTQLASLAGQFEDGFGSFANDAAAGGPRLPQRGREHAPNPLQAAMTIAGVDEDASATATELASDPN